MTPIRPEQIITELEQSAADTDAFVDVFMHQERELAVEGNRAGMTILAVEILKSLRDEKTRPPDDNGNVGRADIFDGSQFSISWMDSGQTVRMNTPPPPTLLRTMRNGCNRIVSVIILLFVVLIVLAVLPGIFGF